MADELNEIVRRIAHLEDQRKEKAEDIKDAYAEAKGKGFNVKALKAAVKVFMLSEEDRLSAVATMETTDDYLSKLGILASTELGQAALRLARHGGTVTVTESPRARHG